MDTSVQCTASNTIEHLAQHSALYRKPNLIYRTDQIHGDTSGPGLGIQRNDDNSSDPKGP
jgi:hypothetical protein